MNTPKSNVLVLKPRTEQRTAGDRPGIVVQEDLLASVEAQLLYRLRCECGRPWFEVDLPKLVACPSCGKKGVVVF